MPPLVLPLISGTSNHIKLHNLFHYINYSSGIYHGYDITSALIHVMKWSFPRFISQDVYANVYFWTTNLVFLKLRIFGPAINCLSGIFLSRIVIQKIGPNLVNFKSFMSIIHSQLGYYVGTTQAICTVGDLCNSLATYCLYVSQRIGKLGFKRKSVW